MINKKKDLKLAVIGLGYVGLPLALEFAKKRKVIGFDFFNQAQIFICLCFIYKNLIQNIGCIFTEKVFILNWQRYHEEI